MSFRPHKKADRILRCCGMKDGEQQANEARIHDTEATFSGQHVSEGSVSAHFRDQKCLYWGEKPMSSQNND